MEDQQNEPDASADQPEFLEAEPEYDPEEFDSYAEDYEAVEADVGDDQPRLIRGLKVSLIPVLAVMLLLILPARVAQGPFRGLTVQSQDDSVLKAAKKAARVACKKANGLPKGAPCRIVIRSIGVDAPVIELGLRSNGTLEVPTNYAETGWWKGGAKPGQTGSTVIVGHVDNRSGPAVFYELPKLKSGTIVTVGRVKMRPVRYVIEDLGRWAKSNFPSEIVYGPTSLAEIRLITCGGVFNQSTGHYTDNIIAFGRMIGTG